MPADQLKIMADNTDGQIQPAIGADIVNPDQVDHLIQGKKKKKKKKKLLNTDTLPEDRDKSSIAPSSNKSDTHIKSAVSCKIE